MEKYNQLLDACADMGVKAAMHNLNVNETEAKRLISLIRNKEYFHHDIMLILMQDIVRLHNCFCETKDKWVEKYPAWANGNNLRVTEYVVDHEIIPLTDGCVFRKLSNRSSKFLLSLGKPEIGIIKDYRRHLQSKIENAPIVQWNGLECHVYEELVAVPLNGKYEFFYLVAANDRVMFIQKKSPKRGQNTWKQVVLSSDILIKEGNTLAYDDEYFLDTNEGKTTFFDIEGFLANLWVAETTATCEPADEPIYTRNEFNSISKMNNHIPLSPSVAYRYIHITDKTWAKYEHANEQVAANHNYHIPSWFVRAHYANRAGKYVMIRAHYAYRKCANVDETPIIDYIC